MKPGLDKVVFLVVDEGCWIGDGFTQLVYKDTHSHMCLSKPIQLNTCASRSPIQVSELVLSCHRPTLQISHFQKSDCGQRNSQQGVFAQ